MDKKMIWGILSCLALLSFFFVISLLIKYPVLQLFLFISTVGFIGFMRFGNRVMFKRNRTEDFHHLNIFMGILIIVVGGSIIWNRYEIQTSISKALINGVKANTEIQIVEGEYGEEILQTEFLKPRFPMKYKGFFFYRLDTFLIIFVLMAGYFSLRWGNENLGVVSLHS